MLHTNPHLFSKTWFSKLKELTVSEIVGSLRTRVVVTHEYYPSPFLQTFSCDGQINLLIMTKSKQHTKIKHQNSRYLTLRHR